MTAVLDRIVPMRPDTPTGTLDGASGPAGAASRPRALSDGEVTAVGFTAAAVVVLGFVGLVNSFANVTAALRPAFGALAPTATLGIDLGIAVFAALGLVLARLDMPIGWLRVVPWALTAATIALNVAPEHTWVGRIAHTCLPMLWVIAVDVGIHTIRVRTGLASGRRMDTIRPSRWLLAPVATLLLWRRMVLWEIRSYPEALAAERCRVIALTELKDRYGHLRVGRRKVRAPWAWRFKAPRKDRALHRLGEHAPVTATPAPSTPPAPAVQPVKATRPAARTAPRKATAGESTADAITRLRATEPGLGTGQIASRLGVSTRTVRRHLASTHNTDRVDEGGMQA